MAVDRNYSREHSPDNRLVACWNSQASRVGVVTAGVDCLKEVSQVDVAFELTIWPSNTLNVLSSEL